MARQCLVAVVDWENKQTKQKEPFEEVPLQQLQEPKKGMGASCAEELIGVKILLDDDRYFQVGASMEGEDRAEKLLFLIQNVDVFA